MNKKKLSVYAGLMFVGFLLFGHVYYYVTGDFRSSYLLESEGGPTKEEGRDLHGILNQNFVYLGHGNQTYAFLSRDGEYVLKLFKKDYFRRTGWVHVLPPVPPFRSFLLYSGAKKQKRKDKLLTGYETAFAHDRENSGLLHFQRCPGTAAVRTTLVTGLGQKMDVDLSGYVFAVQQKVVPTKQELSSLLSQGRVDVARQRVRQLLVLYMNGYSKGIFDHDHNLIDNTGFYGDRAVRQDVGKVVKDFKLTTGGAAEEDLAKIMDERLAPWFRKHYPQYSEVLIAEMHRDAADLQSHLECAGSTAPFLEPAWRRSPLEP